jgi:hypothetical protein
LKNKKESARSSQLTGGEGFTYEDVIAAYFLAALFREEAALAQPGLVTRVAVQQDRQGEPMDDVVVDSDFAAERYRLSLQVKRSVTVSANNADFQNIITKAVETRAKPEFRPGLDRYGFVARAVGDDRLQSLQRIIERAKASTTGAEFDARFRPGGESSKDDIALRNELAGLIKPAEAEADFYRDFVAHRLDGFEPGGDRFADLCNRLAAMSANADGPGLTEILCRQVRLGEGTAKVWTRPSLIADLRTLHPLTVAPTYADDTRILQEAARHAIADIRSDIGGVEIARDRLLETAERAVASHVFSNISGLPGCGKSVVLKRYAERAMAAGPILFLKSDRLQGTSWRTYANALGLRHQHEVEILVELGAGETAIVFIDGIDRIKQEERGIVTDLLRAIETENALSHWRILVTSRDQGLEVLRSWIPSSLYAGTGVGNVAVDRLDDREAETLAVLRQELRVLLFGAPGVQEIARRPFFAAVLADQAAAMGLDTNAPPQTESELIEAWWAAGGYNVPRDAADRRQRAMLDLAETGAPSLGKDIRARRLKGETIAELENLRRDKIIDAPITGTAYKFSHDIFFEWVFFRLLIDRGDEWPDALIAAGEPPLLARIVSLHSQYVFEGGGTWSAGFDPLAALPLRPQWRRAWLLGPSASSHFQRQQAIFENVLLADDGALLKKFLVWFQAERTIPNPVILQNPAANFEGSIIVRAADQWGWPSDPASWARVLTWVLACHDQFPPEARPLAVELFAVWQNMFADLPNPISERIVNLSDVWLTELEGDGKQATPWDDFRRDTAGEIATALRRLILRAARAYPGPAERVIDRAIGLERRGTLFELIMGFAPTLAEVCPQKLAQLVLAEVIEPLPKEEQEAECRSREQAFARHAAIRAKPEAERTEREKQALSGMFIPIGMKTYGFDDTGIDNMHGFFYPPSPAHEPFASLFRHAPDVARELVRTLSNRATTAWLQIHEINAPRYGTPLPLNIDLPWGVQRFWGNQRTYAWYYEGVTPQPLAAAFLSMAHWAHKSLEAGRDIDELIREVVEGHDNVAALGLAVSLAIEKHERSPALLSLIGSQRLWWHDSQRQIAESARDIHLFGLDPRQRMTAVQKEADAYLKARQYRQRSLKDLSYLFALSNDDNEKTRFREALQRFPAELPYDYEEQKTNDGTTADFAERAAAWAKFWNPDNYALERVTDQPNLVALTYRDPEPPSTEAEKRQKESADNLRDFSVVAWAMKSFQHDEIQQNISLAQAIRFAQSRDTPRLFETVAEAGTGLTQTAVVAAAAVAVRFCEDAAERDWGWSVMERVDGITDPEGRDRFGNNPYDPRAFYIAILKRDLAGGTPRADTAARLLTLAGNSIWQIAQTAMMALLDVSAAPTDLVWNAAVLASELCISHRMSNERGLPDRSRQDAHLAAATARALARLHAPGEPRASLFEPPAAWLKVQTSARRRRQSEEWTRPDPDFEPYYAKDLIRYFPVETWATSAADREALLRYADDLVRWTVDRVFPQWEDRRDRERHAAHYIEWLSALADFVARVAMLVPDGFGRFIEPFARHKDDDAIRFVSDITGAVTTRYVYDAPVLREEALTLLGACMDRMLTEHTFDPDSYRAGEINTRDLHPMVISFLLVSVRNAPGAARFANGDWTDLPRLMLLIDKLMMAAGWSAGVMDEYLGLCERAASNFPVEAFERHVAHSMDARGFRQQAWNSSGTFAGVSGAVQHLAEAHHPLTQEQARRLLLLLDRLVDMGDRRAAALQQSEHFRNIQISA